MVVKTSDVISAEEDLTKSDVEFNLTQISRRSQPLGICTFSDWRLLNAEI